WGRPPEPPPPPSSGTLLSWREMNRRADAASDLTGSEAVRGRGRGGEADRGSGRSQPGWRAAWLFLYLFGLAAMTTALPIVFALHASTLVPLLLFPAGGLVALGGAILARLERSDPG